MQLLLAHNIKQRHTVNLRSAEYCSVLCAETERLTQRATLAAAKLRTSSGMAPSTFCLCWALDPLSQRFKVGSYKPESADALLAAAWHFKLAWVGLGWHQMKLYLVLLLKP